MGQKINPISNRIGIIRGWDSNWYGGDDYAAKLLEDSKIREYLNARISKVNLSKIVIERTLKLITVTIHTARPGAIIGKGGQEVDKLKEELRKITNKEVQINIFEVKRPELDANIVANNIARQVEGRVSYRRAIKMAVASTMRMGAEGIKVLISGRLGGGVLGIKVWICNGEVYGKRDLSPNVGTFAKPTGGSGERRDDRRGRGGRRRDRRPRGGNRDNAAE